MRTVLLLILFFPLLAAANHVECEVRYSWLDANNQVVRPPVQNWKLPLERVQYDTIVREWAEKVWTSPDKRLEVVVQGLVPISGDITKFNQLRITLTDKKSDTYVLPYPISFGEAKSDVTQANLSYLPDNPDTVPPYGLGISCELILK